MAPLGPPWTTRFDRRAGRAVAVRCGDGRRPSDADPDGQAAEARPGGHARRDGASWPHAPPRRLALRLRGLVRRARPHRDRRPRRGARARAERPDLRGRPAHGLGRRGAGRRARVLARLGRPEGHVPPRAARGRPGRAPLPVRVRAVARGQGLARGDSRWRGGDRPGGARRPPGPRAVPVRLLGRRSDGDVVPVPAPGRVRGRPGGRGDRGATAAERRARAYPAAVLGREPRRRDLRRARRGRAPARVAGGRQLRPGALAHRPARGGGAGPRPGRRGRGARPGLAARGGAARGAGHRRGPPTPRRCARGPRPS